MTDSTFPFAGGSEPAAHDEAPASRRNVIVAGAVAGALVLGAAGYLLLGGGGSPAVTVAAGVIPDSPSIATSPASTPGAKPVVKVPPPKADHPSRNPFKALYVVPVTGLAGPSGAGPIAAGSTITETGTGSTATGSTGTSGTGSTAAGSTGTSGTGSTAAGSTGQTTLGATGMGAAATGSPSPSPSARLPYALKLVAISKPSPETRFYTFTVDRESDTVIPAERFGRYGELVVLAFTKNAAGTATGAILQVGHDDPIDVKIGERVSVK